MPSLNQQLSTSDSGSHLARWIVIAVLAAAAVVGVVLLVVYGGAGGSAPGY
jgi:hypothetical protein